MARTREKPNIARHLADIHNLYLKQKYSKGKWDKQGILNYIENGAYLCQQGQDEKSIKTPNTQFLEKCSVDELLEVKELELALLCINYLKAEVYDKIKNKGLILEDGNKTLDKWNIEVEKMCNNLEKRIKDARKPKSGEQTETTKELNPMPSLEVMNLNSILVAMLRERETVWEGEEEREPRTEWNKIEPSADSYEIDMEDYSFSEDEGEPYIVVRNRILFNFSNMADEEGEEDFKQFLVQYFEAPVDGKFYLITMSSDGLYPDIEDGFEDAAAAIGGLMDLVNQWIEEGEIRLQYTNSRYESVTTLQEKITKIMYA